MMKHRVPRPRGGISPGRRLKASLLAGILLAMSAPACQAVSIRLAMNKGVSHFKAKEYELAAEAFKEAIRIDPKYIDAYLDLGLTYMELYEPGSTHPKDVEYANGAIESFKRYIRLNPENDKVKDYLINVCSTSQRMDEAIEFFLEDLDKKPNDLALTRMIAGLYHRAGDTTKAIEWFEKAAQLDPKNAEAWYSVGVSAWGHSYNTPYMEYEQRMALLDKGIEAFAKAKALRNDYFEAVSYENLIYREKMKYDISPAQAVVWRQKADELLQQAMEMQNRAKSAAGQPAGEAGTAPAHGDTEGGVEASPPTPQAAEGA
jgi:tetratricopeptide (TPR) repeat protein